MTCQLPRDTGGSLTTNIDPNGYRESLDFAAMFNAEARKGDGLIFTDYMYLHLGGQNAVMQSVTGPLGNVQVPVNVGGSFEVVSNVWTLAGGYSVLHGQSGSLDLFEGMRLLNLNGSAGWRLSGPIGLPSRAGSVSLA